MGNDSLAITHWSILQVAGLLTRAIRFAFRHRHLSGELEGARSRCCSTKQPSLKIVTRWCQVDGEKQLPSSFCFYLPLLSCLSFTRLSRGTPMDSRQELRTVIAK